MKPHIKVLLLSPYVPSHVDTVPGPTLDSNVWPLPLLPDCDTSVKDSPPPVTVKKLLTI